MPNRTILFVLLAGLALAGAAVVLPWLNGSNDVPVVRWNESQEVAIDAQRDDTDTAVAEAFGADGQREQVAVADDLAAGERSEVLLRGRVVDRFHAPVADAKVWLDFGRGGQRARGGRDRRVPEPVQTDSDGRFAFQGQTFRNLRVNLLVVHGRHAPTQFDRNLGEVGSELDLGELAVNDGGELIGRVIDLSGNGIPFAEVRLQPDGDNWMRFQRDRNDVLPPQQTDANGYYSLRNVAAGDWRIAASAKKHENGSSEQVESNENQRSEVADIVLGPGFELAGIVMDRLGKPIADAEVIARPRNQNGGRGGRGGGRGGQGGPFGGGIEQSTRTDKDGRFFLERLPDALLDVSAQKKGYLAASVHELDPEQTQPVYLTLEDGLSIRGVVTDAVAGSPVIRYSVTAQWVRSLPVEGQAQEDMRALMTQMRDPTLDEATRTALRQRMETMRQQARGERMAGAQQAGGNWQQGGRGGRDARPERHEEGRFAETGLTEGIYVVRIESDAHATYRSAEVELRNGAPAPELTIALARGFLVSGVVNDNAGKPIANARVELQRPQEEAANLSAAPAAEASTQTGGRGGRGGRGGDVRGRFNDWMNGQLPSATTNEKGEFQIEHAPAGTFVTRASARAHEDAMTKPFALDKDTPGIVLALQRRGSLSGRILGATKEELEQVRVVAAPVGDGADFGAMWRGGNPFASVSADGTYLFDELKAGDYAVRAFLGSSMRDLIAQYQRGELAADVSIQDGEASALDVTIIPPQSGIVRGSVLHNGTPADGFTVTLQLQSDSGNDAAPAPGAFGGRGGRGGMGGMGARTSYNARVDNQGRFTIDEVQPGTYSLTVSAARRSGTLHKELVVLTPQGVVDLAIMLTTASVAGIVEPTEGVKPEEINGAVMLLAGATEIPADFSMGGRGGPGGGADAQGSFRARIEKGAFTFEQVPPGNYLAVISIRGRARTSTQVSAVTGQKTEVRAPLGAVDPNAAAAPARQPGGGQQRQGGNATPNQPGQPNGGRANRGAQQQGGQPGQAQGGNRRGG